MNDDAFFAFLSHLVLYLTATTLIFALGAYATLMLRRRRPAEGRGAPPEEATALLSRYAGDDDD